MESTLQKIVENIAIDENFNPKISHVFTSYSVEDKEKINESLLEDFRQVFLRMGPSVVIISLFRKAHFVSCLGYHHCVTIDMDIKNFVIDYLKNSRRPYVLSSPNNTFLKSLTTTWEIFMEALTIINAVLVYMKNLHSIENKLDNLEFFGKTLFRTIIFQDFNVLRRFYACMSEFKQDTTKDCILLNSDRLLIESVSKMCYALKMKDYYELYLKSLLLKLTTEYFQLLSKDYLFHHSTWRYFENANAKIIEEMNRIHLKLDTDSVNKIRGIITTELILKNMKTILEMKSCDVVYMLENNQFDDLRCLYNSLCFVDGGLKVIFDIVCPYFCELGSLIVLTYEKMSDATSCIESLLDLKKKFNFLMNNVFNNNKLFYDIVSNEFSVFLQLNSLVPEFLCQYIDEKLRKEKFTFIKNCVMVDLNTVEFLIKQLQDKSSFEKFYQNKLARRLLDCANVNMKMENEMINIIKNAYTSPCDNVSFASTIQGMCNDKFLLSKSIMKKYNDHVLVDNVILGIMKPFDFNIDILSSAYWPVEFQQPTFNVPPFALNALNGFMEIYSKYETNTTLKLLPQYGTVELEVTYYSQPGATKQSCDGENLTTKIECVEKKVNVVVSTFEMFVLDLFNSNDFLTYETILKKTMIPEKNLVFSLRELMNTHKLLIKLPICEEIKLSDTFYVRESLECI